MENQEVTVISSSEALEAINRAEVDIQIATAKKYPRDLKKVLSQIEALATMDSDTAEDCFYAMKRGKGDDAKLVEGLSVRFAEIIANSWGNLRVQTMITANDGKMITARGVCHDLESNTAVSVEVKRRITDRYGKTYSEDMQVVTGNAASAIAYRNAVLKVVPKAITKKIVEETKKVAMGKALDLETTRTRAVEHFNKMGITTDALLKHLEINSLMDIDKEKIIYLRGLITALKEGTTTIAETFPNKDTATADNDNEALTRVREAIASTSDVAKLEKMRSQINKLPEEVRNELTMELSEKIDSIKAQEVSK